MVYLQFPGTREKLQGGFWAPLKGLIGKRKEQLGKANETLEIKRLTFLVHFVFYIFFKLTGLFVISGYSGKASGRVFRGF